MNSVSSPRVASRFELQLDLEIAAAADCGRALTLTFTSSFGALSLGRSERGAPGFSKERSLMYWPSTWMPGCCWALRRRRAAGRRPPFAACVGHRWLAFLSSAPA